MLDDYALNKEQQLTNARNKALEWQRMFEAQRTLAQNLYYAGNGVAASVESELIRHGVTFELSSSLANMLTRWREVAKEVGL